jgi:hypothetical protein
MQSEVMIFLFKLVSAPFLILGVSLLARRFGPAIGGLVMGIPLVSGPVSVFTAIEQGAVFAREAAAANLVGQVSTCLFCFAFARSSQRFGAWVCLLIGVTTYCSAIGLGNQTTWTPIGALSLLIGCLVVLPRLIPVAQAKAPAATLPWWDLPARMIAASTFVVVITTASGYLGPQLSGLLTPFPLFISTLAVFTHLNHGGAAASAMMRGVIQGTLSFTSFFVVVIFGLGQDAITLTYCGAAVASIATSGIVYLVLRRKPAGGRDEMAGRGLT